MTIQRIIHLLEITNTSAKTLTQETGLSGSAISEWKKKKAAPSAAAIVKIAEYFSVPVDYLLEIGVFSCWDEIMTHKDAVWNEIQSSEIQNMYLITENGESLLSLFNKALFYEANDLAAIRLFSWAIKSVTLVDSDNDPVLSQVSICFSESLSLVARHEPEGIQIFTMKDLLDDFQTRKAERGQQVFSLSDDERRIIQLYRTLDDYGKGAVLKSVQTFVSGQTRSQA